MQFFTQVLVLLLLLAGLPVQAAEVTHMYEASRAVGNQDRDSRIEAFDQGFREVLVRVSGNSRAAGVSANAQSFVQQYRYLALDKSQPQPGVSASATHTLWMQFDETAIRNLLRDKNLPVWGAQRPAVLMWLAVREGKNRYILRRQDASPIKEALEREAQRRGLPLVWPQYDAADSAALSFSDIWGGFHEPMLKVSQRYPAAAIIAGKVDVQGNSWRGEWSLLLEDKQENWVLQATDMTQLLASGMDFTTDRIANQFAVMQSSAGASTLQLQVDGINSAESYAKVAHYLQSLALVKQVYVTAVNGSQVSFHIDLNGGEEDLKRILSIGKTLVPDTLVPAVNNAQAPTAPPATSVQPVLMRYRLQG